MKIFSNYFSVSNFNKYKSQSFTSNPSNTDNKIEVNELAQPVKAYNVRIPIAYTHVDDIKLTDDITAKCYKLANGQKVVIVPKDGPTVVKTYVNTGSFNEPDNLRGISHFIEHNLFNGSDDLGDKVFFDEVNKMGADTNASTSFANTNYFISSNLLEDTDLENKIQLHAGMLQSPKFLLEKLEKEKKIVNSEINMCLSENENLGFSQTVKNLFNIKSTSLDLVAGSTDNITALTRDDVVNYFNNNYYPANMTTVITGEVDVDKTMELISKYFNSNKLPQGERQFEKMIPIQKSVRQDIISPKSDSGAATVFVGFVGPENNNTKDKIYLQALSNLAAGLHNSRTSDLERKYGINIDFSPERLSSNPHEKSLMLIETRVAEGKAETFLTELYDKINDLSKNPPTEEELTAIKNKMKKSYDRIFESSYGLNNAIGISLLNDNIAQIRYFNEIVDNMSADDILNTAKKYLDLNKAALTVVHPHSITKEQIENRYKLISELKAYDIPFTGLNKKTPLNIDNIKTYRTHNNFEVVFNNAATNTIQYNFSIAKQNWTPKKAAIAEILFEILENAGTTYQSVEQLNKKADILGVSTKVYADHYGIEVYGNFPINSTNDALNFINEKIKNPNISQKELDRAKTILKDHFTNSEVNPYDKFFKAMFKGTALEFSTNDMLKSLDDITLEDIKAFYNEIFQQGQGKVVVTGPFEKNPDLKLAVFNSLADYPKLKPWDNSLEKIYSPIEKSEVYTDVNMKNQADIVMGYKFKHNGNVKDSNCISLLNEILGGSSSSRLFSDLRENRHLAYSVSSSYTSLGDLGTMFLKIETTTQNQETGEKTFDNLQKSIEGFKENIEKITKEKVSDEELAAAKKRLKTELLNMLEMNAGKNGVIWKSIDTPYGIDLINKQFSNIDSITVEDIQNTARYIFNSKPIYSITATKDTLDANKTYLNSLIA